MKGDEEKARASGCDHYVTKPYSPIQLLRSSEGFLANRGRENQVRFVGLLSGCPYRGSDFCFG